MDGEPVTLARVPAVGNRLYVSFGLGNELHVVDLNDGNQQRESTASVVQWGQLSAVQRRITYDSLGQYQALHQSGAEALSLVAWSTTLRYSRTVSSILGANGVRGTEATADELAVLREQALWDLLALFFLEGGSSGGGGEQGLVAQDLARWLRSHAVAVAGGVGASPLPPTVAALLRGAPLPEGEEGYWPTITRLVALGWIDAAIELLGLHSAWLRYDGSAMLAATDGAAQALVGSLEAATLLLRRFPVLSAPGVVHGAGRECASPAEFAAYRRTWQAQCTALASDGGMWRACEGADIATADGLRSVLGVLVGEETALGSAITSWMELLVAQLLHVYPATHTQAELCQLARHCFETGGGAAAPEFLQVAAALLEACVELDAQDAMRVCSAYCSSWFMAHAPDLMAAHPAGAGVLGQELAHFGGSQVEFYTLEHAAALMPHASTWPLAAVYLAWCPAHGQAVLQALLQRLPLEASQAWTARRGAEIAQYQGLSCLAEDVHRMQGVLCWQAGMLGAALTWLAACGDVPRLDIALQPLAAVVITGNVSEEQRAALEALQPVLTALPPSSSNAALLAVHRLLTLGGGGGGGGLHEAVAALSQLPEAIRDSCLQLVCSVVPALPPGKLSERDVLYLLEWLLSAEGRLLLLPGKQRAALAAAIQVARLALVRSLAGCHMKQQAVAVPAAGV